nr:RecName: Full=Alpha-amylase; AltName: Full=1,4-alpha-D-glucan glucanohydrolase [Cytobacillus firmus]
MLVGKKVQTF